MSRRSLLVPAVLAALVLPVAPALAGEDDGSNSPATLHMSQGCVSGHRTKLAVTGENIATVAFYVNGKLVKTVTTPTSSGRYVISMPCSRLIVGANRGRAVATFEQGSSPAQKTLRFQLTRGQQTSPRFTG